VIELLRVEALIWVVGDCCVVILKEEKERNG